ncbi:MAG TPA: 7-cyano-7-deazaguanine synthase QueC [Deltaproteobacteria bacterium]|nr:7-cyano-7-deazaguanine synthase QueC [Deltaproteobacteria bacterium]
MEDAVILLSGGMDSGVLLAWAKERYREIHALTFNYGSKHAGRETAMACRLAQHYGVTFFLAELPFVRELFRSSLLAGGPDVPDGPYQTDGISSTVVPFRNGIMLSVAVGYAETLGATRVLIASHTGDHPIYPDCTPDFTEAMSRAAFYGTFSGVRVEAPFSGYDKRRIAQTGRSLGFDFTMTWSCYRGGDLHCGTCPTCLERKEALGYNEGLDPTRYLA